MDPEEMRSKIATSSAKWNLGLTSEDVDGFGEALGPLAKMMMMMTAKSDQGVPDMKYPRDQGYRPPPEENPYNAWYYKTNILGASSGKLSGKRVAIKDNICVAGVPMMVGSHLLEGYIPKVDATVVTRILDEGGTIAGKAVCEDMCFSGSSFSSATGPVLNVNDVKRTAGGSSSGCASLIACGDVDVAIGTDQAGSVRIPAAFSGIVGLKPTFGLVPYTGATSLVYCVDHVGPMARNVKDCALLLEVIAGADDVDPRQDITYTPPEYATQLKSDVSGVKIGVVKESLDSCEPEVANVVKEAAAKLQKAGALVEEVSVASGHMGLVAATILTLLGTYETHYRDDFQAPLTGGLQNLTLMDFLQEHRPERLSKLHNTAKFYCLAGELFTEGERRRMMCQAQSTVQKLRQEYNSLLKKYDVLIMPTVPHVADEFPPDGSKIKDEGHHAHSMTLMLPIFNVTHHPALSLPCGHVEGLPVGLLIVGKHYDEQTVLNVAYSYESIRDKTSNGCICC